MKGKTLGVIVLSVVIALGGSGCGKKSEEAFRQNDNNVWRQPQTEEIPGKTVYDDTQQQYQTEEISEEISNKLVSAYTQQPYQTKTISGKIIDIDEDSFAIALYSGGANFNFENIRIEGDDGKVHKLISPGPTSYRIGDKIQNLNFEQLPTGEISYSDLTMRTVNTQFGSIEADGIIK